MRRPILQQLPQRRNHPLARAQTYISRRIGLFDPARELRRQRALIRTGR